MKNAIYVTICFLAGIIWALLVTDTKIDTKKDSEVATFQNKTFTANGVSFKMIAVKGGIMTMGCTPEQEGECYPDEGVANQKNISSFMIGETEVTQELWNAVMGNNPSKFKGDLQRPVERVPWEKCQEFINKLNSITGKNFRLPSEEEWEYAARGGQSSKSYKYCGSNNVEEIAWWKNNSGTKTHPVKTKKPNELGIYDMSGNVYEWCNDYYSDAKGVIKFDSHVLRGGCWSATKRNLRVSYRYFAPTNNPSERTGFRLAL